MASETTRVAIIGCGFMGTAILQGLLRSSSTSSTEQKYSYAACVRTSSSLDRLKRDLATHQDAIECGSGPEAAARMASDAKIIILGVAPNDLSATLRIPGIVDAFRSKVVISLLAGIPHLQLETELQTLGGDDKNHCTFIRLLPSLGSSIAESVSLIADPALPQSSPTAAADLALAETLFTRLGSVTHVPERLMNEATALGAVAHALAITSVDTLADAAAADGVPRPVAERIAAQCLRSASSLFVHGGMTPAAMKAAMAVPGGITINAILDLERAARPGIAEAGRRAVAYTNRMAAS